MILRRYIRYAMLFSLLLVALATCAGASPVTMTPTASGVTAAEGRPRTLFLWHTWSDTEQRTLVSLVDSFNRTHPQTQIIVQARPLAALGRELRSTALSGSGPHLVIVKNHTLGALVEDGLLLPLDSLISPAELGQLLPSALGGAQVRRADGSTALYGMPLAFDTLALYYNKVNLDVPPPDTDTLLRNARGLTDARTRPPVWGLALNLSLDNTIGYLYAFGGRVFDEEGNLVLGTSGRQGAERWLEWLLTLRQDQQILAGLDGIAVDNALKAQEALMTIDWAHALPGYRALWPDSMGVAPLPRLSEADAAPQPYVQSDVVALVARTSDAADQHGAVEFIRFLVSEPAQAQLLQGGKQPVLLTLKLGAPQPEYEAAQAFRTQAQQGLPMPNSRVANEMVWEALQIMQYNVLRGQTAPADAVTGADAVLRSRLSLPPP